MEQELAATQPAEDLWPLDRIVTELRTWREELQIEAIRQAQRQRQAIGPLLINALQDMRTNARRDEDGDGFDAYLLICLLTEFQTPGGLEAILDFLRADANLLDLALGDTLHEDMPAILAGWIHDPDILDRSIGDRSLDRYVRWTCVATMPFLVRDGRLSREDAVSRLHAHLIEAVQRGDSSITDALCYELGQYGAPEPLETIREAYANNLIKDWLSDLKGIERDIQRGDEQFRTTMDNLRPSGVADTVEFASSWHEESRWAPGLSTGPQFETLEESWDVNETEPESERSWVSEPIRRAAEKVGRNDPCPCGSGKKYKKCCGHPDRMIQ